MKINYQSVTGWWVYCLITPDGMFYIGCSGMSPEERWKKNLYKDKSVWKYIEQYGWEKIRKVIKNIPLNVLNMLKNGGQRLKVKYMAECIHIIGNIQTK